MATINSGSGTQLSFTTTGTSTTNAVNTFAGAVNAHVSSYVNFDTGVSTGSAFLGATVPLPGTVLYTLGVAGDNVTAVSGQYTLDMASGPTTIVGSDGGADSVLAVGALGGSGLDYIATAGGNTIIFNDGRNTYNATAGDTGLDSIYAGAGFDTINTGAGATSVFAGSGNALINLNDTATSTFHRDVAVIHDGRNTVNASGAVDVVFSSALGQVLNGGAGTDYFVLQPDSQSGVNNLNSGIVSSTGLNEVNGGSGTTIVFDQNQGNTITAGTGLLYFVGESSRPDSIGTATNATEANTVVASQGTLVAFSASGDSLTAVVSGSAQAFFVAGNGNETLNAATSTGTVVFYGSSNDNPVNSTVLGASDSVIGGAGTNFFVTGVGDETLVGGSGTNVFFIEGGVSAGATITIQDFNPSGQDFAVVEGTSIASSATILIAGQASLQYTLTDGTVVNFQDVTSLDGHIH